MDLVANPRFHIYLSLMLTPRLELLIVKGLKVRASFAIAVLTQGMHITSGEPLRSHATNGEF